MGGENSEGDRQEKGVGEKGLDILFTMCKNVPRMDTDYLTGKSYQLLLMASEVSHVLMVQQGVICTHSKDEDEFLKNVLEYFQEA